MSSDNPDVYATTELSHVSRAQDRIMLATSTSLDKTSRSKSTKPKEAMYKHVDAHVGWDAVFFKDVFRSLIQTSQAEADLEGTLRIRPKARMRQRGWFELVGRAYLLDLGGFGDMDLVMCGVSAIGCRMLAVMLGWEMAFLEEEWKKVDGTDG